MYPTTFIFQYAGSDFDKTDRGPRFRFRSYPEVYLYILACDVVVKEGIRKPAGGYSLSAYTIMNVATQ